MCTQTLTRDVIGLPHLVGIRPSRIKLRAGACPRRPLKIDGSISKMVSLQELPQPRSHDSAAPQRRYCRRVANSSSDSHAKYPFRAATQVQASGEYQREGRGRGSGRLGGGAGDGRTMHTTSALYVLLDAGKLHLEQDLVMDDNLQLICL